MKQQDEQELCHVLLTEVLAYQFAKPVRWIETQDVLLTEKQVNRVAEIGPSDTLIAMAKKTIASKYREHDSALPQPRTLQCYEDDANEIHHVYETIAPSAPTSEPAKTRTKDQTTITTQPIIHTEIPVPEGPATLSVSVNFEDKTLPTIDVIVGVVAQKLRKPFKDVDCSKSIKSLVEGRSTMENEIVGDLHAIFDTLPDRAEETVISELARILTNDTSSTKLTIACGKLTARLFSQKMPGGMTATDARKHLEDRWGFGQGRQDAILLRTAAKSLPTRLKNTTEAKLLLDTVAEAYAAEVGLNLHPCLDIPVPAATPSITKIQNGQLSPEYPQVAVARSSHLEEAGPSRIDETMEAQSIASQARTESDTLRRRLDILTAELGDEFIEGISPMWSPMKIRKYESCWNWVLQDLLQLVNSVLRGERHVDNAGSRQVCDMIVRRSDQRLLDVMRFLANDKTWNADELLISTVKGLMVMLIEDSQSWLFRSQTSRFFEGGSSSCSTPPTLNYNQTILVSDYHNSQYNHCIRVSTKVDGVWRINNPLTDMYQSGLASLQRYGLRLKGKTVLLTGAGTSSIGRALLIRLLIAGARVLVTTSRFSPTTCQEFQKVYKQYGSSGSQLIVAPFNQGSKGDCENLVKYIFDARGGLGWDLDYVIPFAALSQEGQIDNLGSKPELAHRIMLTNVLRLLGTIRSYKQAGPINPNPTRAILPLSPNHGIIGNDGLYSESKAGLEMLLNKWHSEQWSSYISICGAVIGWVRGTGLMAANDVVASEVEARAGIRTFSQSEMAEYLIALFAEPLGLQNEEQPMRVDLSGDMAQAPNIHSILATIRGEMVRDNKMPDFQQRPEAGDKADYGANAEHGLITPMANLKLHFPKLPDYDEEIEPLHHLRGMADLDRVAVITGMSEVGPWGNARTRWEMEAHGMFSLEGCIEMAWMMGLITHHNGRLDGDRMREHYIGWIDVKSKAPVADAEVKALYERQILEHAGIRVVEPELDEGYDPSRKQFLHEVVLTNDLPPFKAPAELAKQFSLEHGEMVDVVPGPSDEAEWTVRLRRGATILVPKALRFDRAVAGQIPQGWDARRYGVPDWAAEQIGRETLFAIVSTAEALLFSGIVDPYELYQYMHVSEVGNCVGSGQGGLQAMKKIFRHRYLDKSVQSDALQETFLNTTAAWINMLLLSSSGPIRTPVGACATSIESLESGYELITSGKAKVVLVGGHDDMTEEVAYEFASMRATVNTDEEAQKGRIPSEMSRPMTSTRDGFVEAQGSGVQVLVAASIALEMGLPIYGIVSWVGTSSDKIGRSVPSPGKGILVNARESRQGLHQNPLLDISFRRDRLARQRRQIQDDLQHDLQTLEQLMESDDQLGGNAEQKRCYLHSEAVRREKEALRHLGHDFWVSIPDISPIRGALSAWGLTIDDLDFVSLHGTSTGLNDKNETSVIQKQLSYLGRTLGNPVYAISQKYLTGHSKGAAGAWMLNGALQALDTGLIPGNRNADDISPELRESEFLFFPQESIQTTSLKACSITSFGFGQKGAQAIVVHPRYLYATLSDANEFRNYRRRLFMRQRQATKFFQKGIATNALFVAKEKPPYEAEQESRVLLDSMARMKGNSYINI